MSSHGVGGKVPGGGGCWLAPRLWGGGSSVIEEGNLDPPEVNPRRRR